MKKIMTLILLSVATTAMAETLYVGSQTGKSLSVVQIYSDSIQECAESMQSLKDELMQEQKIVRTNKCVGPGKDTNGVAYTSFAVPGKFKVVKKAKGEVIVLH